MERPTKKIADPLPKTVNLRARVSEAMRDEFWTVAAALGLEESEALRRAVLEWIKIHKARGVLGRSGSDRSGRLQPPKPDLVMLNAPRKGKIKD